MRTNGGRGERKKDNKGESKRERKGERELGI